jgi:hypothetical protein
MKSAAVRGRRPGRRNTFAITAAIVPARQYAGSSPIGDIQR